MTEIPEKFHSSCLGFSSFFFFFFLLLPHGRRAKRERKSAGGDDLYLNSSRNPLKTPCDKELPSKWLSGHKGVGVKSSLEAAAQKDHQNFAREKGGKVRREQSVSSHTC